MLRSTQILGPALLLLAGAAFAAPPVPGAPDTPENKAVGNAVTQPLTDLNVQRKEISPILLNVLDNPYSLDGIGRCRELIAAVEELNTVLGPDFDSLPAEDKGKKRRKSATNIAGGLISSFVPFRWLVREVSGANKSDEDYRAAIYAGVVRRGFLKGVGKQRKCKAPGSPMPIERAIKAMPAPAPEKS